jgi:hypothetical protein
MEPTSALPRLSRRGRLLLGGVVAAVVVGLAVIHWQWRHPEPVFDGGYGIAAPRPVGASVWTSLGPFSGDEGSVVEIRGLQPTLGRDEAAVRVEYLVCELDPDRLERLGVGGFGYGMPERAVDRSCVTTRPAIGASIELGADPPHELIVGVTPTRPGRSVVTGHEAAYRVGWQVGREDVAVTVRVRARPD